jgi:hypothetical protein
MVQLQRKQRAKENALELSPGGFNAIPGPVRTVCMDKNPFPVNVPLFNLLINSS